MQEEIPSLEKFNEEGIALDVILPLRFIDETLDIEMVVEAENTTVSLVMKRNSKIICMPSFLKNLQSRAALCETNFQV